MGWTPFLSSNQQRQSTEDNSKHKSQPEKTTDCISDCRLNRRCYHYTSLASTSYNVLITANFTPLACTIKFGQFTKWMAKLRATNGEKVLMRGRIEGAG